MENQLIKRLPRYYRYLTDLLDEGVERISSNDLSQKMRERIPSQETIEKEIYDMLLKVREENIRHSPSVCVIKKID